MRLKRTNALLLMVLSGSCALAAEGDLKWYRFNKRFITAHYTGDAAFSKVGASSWAAAQNVHDRSCGGKDGELHIGVRESAISWDSQNQVSSGKGSANDPDWGIVAELPNAAQGQGPAKLTNASGKPLSFNGYLRVWDEGHAQGQVHPSNPHHVMEVHPAWGFSGQGVSFSAKRLVAAIPDFSGYGASKFKSLFSTLNASQWPRMYQDADYIYIKMRESPNFFQLPVQVREIREIGGGHEVQVDVYSDAQFQNRVYQNLRAVTVKGSLIDRRFANGVTGYRAGDNNYLLGFFSFNLKKAMALSAAANSEANAAMGADALEFFAFGRPLERAVSSSQCVYEGEQP